MINKKKIYLFVIIIIFFLIDRVSKILILKSFLNNSLSEIYINSFLNFSLVWNSGIGFIRVFTGLPLILLIFLSQLELLD